MQGVVDFILKFAPGVSPHYYERTRRSVVPLRDRFESRLGILTASLGDPSVEAEPVWYPNAATIACWRRDDKTLVSGGFRISVTPCGLNHRSKLAKPKGCACFL